MSIKTYNTRFSKVCVSSCVVIYTVLILFLILMKIDFNQPNHLGLDYGYFVLLGGACLVIWAMTLMIAIYKMQLVLAKYLIFSIIIGTGFIISRYV